MSPQRAPKPCRTTGCPGLAVRDGCCAACAQAREHAVDERRGSSAARGYGHRWRRLRRMYLRANPQCALCDAPATEVHHVVARRDGGSDAWGNLQALCKSCHSTITAREYRGGGLESL